MERSKCSDKMFSKEIGIKVLARLEAELGPYQAYDGGDIRYVVFWVAIHTCLYLKEDESNVMRQGSFGIDCCEHMFAKYGYNSYTSIQT